MRKFLRASLVWTLAAGLCMAGSCQAQQANEEKDMSGNKSDIVVRANTEFGLGLYSKLAGQGNGNIFFSPASVHVAMSMAFAGARGQTAEQMAGTLGLTGKSDDIYPAFRELLKSLGNPGKGHDKKPVYQLSMVNRLWGKSGYKFKDDYLSLVKKNFLSELVGIDFSDEPAARKTINDWVAGQTADRIKDLIPERMIKAATRLVITNAVYFKAEWEEKFSEGVTSEGDFFVTPDKPVKARLMRNIYHFKYAETPDLQLLDLPYKNRELAMTILLPKKADALAAVEKSLSADSLKKLTDQAATAVRVDATVPKFKIECSFDLVDMLKSMGISSAFEPLGADFTGIAENADGPLFISAVLHKAFVAVDEEGTEAAAATAIAMEAGCAPPAEQEDPKIFKADHPFLFMIRHNATGEILFMGRIADPTK